MTHNQPALGLAAASALPSPAAREEQVGREKPIASDECEQSAESTAAAALHNSLRHSLHAELAQVEKLIVAATSSRYAEVAALGRLAAAQGGKRLRPTLVWLSAQAIGAQPLPSAARRDLAAIAAAVELVHAASLVHDDVMDAADQRRHQPTIVGQAGNSAAVLLGDLLFTRAYALAASVRSTYPARKLAAAATRLCEGELRQQAAAGQWQMSFATYRSLLVQKTGALCAVSCQLGAWQAAAERQQRHALSRFGKLLGLAFQIYDDWLDYWGTEHVGKTLGTDLLQSKPTLPLLRLLHTTPVSQQAGLRELLEHPHAAARAEIRRRLDASDAGEYTLRVAQKYSRLAQQQLRCLAPSPARDSLAAIAHYSVHRSL